MVSFNAGNAASGAITGASLGSMFGPIGLGVGAVAGGALGLFGSKKKKPKKPKPISAFDPQQQQLYKQQIDSLQGAGPYSNLYNFDANAANQNFDSMYSRPAYQSFQENIVPTITGQFRQGNLQNSSYLGESLSKAGRDVQQGLDAHRANLLYQGSESADVRKSQALENILNRTTFGYQQPGAQQPGTIDQILGQLGPAAGEWFADYLKKS